MMPMHSPDPRLGNGRRRAPAVAGILLTALLAMAAPQAQAEGLAGSWEGRYSCDGRTEGRMVLDLTETAGQIAGTFRFDHPDGAGAYHVIGREDGAGGFALAPQDWIDRPSGVMALTLQGRFKAGGRAIEGSLIPCGGGSFIAEPARSPDAPAAEIGQMATLSGGPYAGLWRGGISCSQNRRGKTEVYPVELSLAMDGEGVGGGGSLRIYKTRGSGEGPAFEQRFVAHGLVSGTGLALRTPTVDDGGTRPRLRAIEMAPDGKGGLTGTVTMNECQTIALDPAGDAPAPTVDPAIHGLWAGSTRGDRPLSLMLQIGPTMAEATATWPANRPEIERDRLRLSLVPHDAGLGRLFWVPVGQREAEGTFRPGNPGGTHSIAETAFLLLTPGADGLTLQLPVLPQDVAGLVAGTSAVTRHGRDAEIRLTRPDAATQQALAAGEAPPQRFEGGISGQLAAAPSREAQCRLLDAWVAPEAAGVDIQRQSQEAALQHLAQALSDDRFLPVFGLPFLLTTQPERRSLALFIRSNCHGMASDALLLIADAVLMTETGFARYSARIADRRETAAWLDETRASLPALPETEATQDNLARLRQEAERQRDELLPEERSALLAEIDRRAAEVRAALILRDLAALPDDGFAKGDLGAVLRAVDLAQDLPGDLAADLRAAAAAKAAAILAGPKAEALAILPALPNSLDGLRQAQSALAPLAAWRAGMEAAFGSLDPEGTLRPLHGRIAELRADPAVQAEFAGILSKVTPSGDARGAVYAAAAPYIAADDLIHAPDFARIVDQAILEAEIRQIRLVDNSVSTSAGEPTIEDIASFVLERVRSANDDIRRQEQACLNSEFNDPVSALACLSQPALWTGQAGQFGVVLLQVEKLGCTEEAAQTRYLCLFIQTIDINLPQGMGFADIPALTSGEVLDALFLRTGTGGWRVVWGDVD